MTEHVIADLRRLYLHMKHGGLWNHRIDTHRLSRGIAELENLHREIQSLTGELKRMRPYGQLTDAQKANAGWTEEEIKHGRHWQGRTND